MGHHFDALTMTPHQFGCWSPKDSKDLFCEHVSSIYAVRFNSTTEKIREDKAWMEAFARNLGIRLGQESVLIITDVVDDFTKTIEGERKQTLPESLVEKTDNFFSAVRG